MLLLDITIVNVALAGHPGGPCTRVSRDLQWVVDAYALTLASFPAHGRGSLADIYGRRVL